MKQNNEEDLDLLRLTPWLSVTSNDFLLAFFLKLYFTKNNDLNKSN